MRIDIFNQLVSVTECRPPSFSPLSNKLVNRHWDRLTWNEPRLLLISYSETSFFWQKEKYKACENDVMGTQDEKMDDGIK